MPGRMCHKMDVLSRMVTFISSILLLNWNYIVAQNIPTYYLDDYCSRELDMTMAKVKSGRLMLHRPGQNPVYPSCYMLIKAPSNKRLSFKFHSFDIESPRGCTSNFLRIYQDHRREFPISEKLCNSGKTPDQAFITNGEEAAVWLNKENYLLDQVELVFTAFSFSPCLGGDYQCDNDHCISSDLYCNDEYDNCGDESDICLLKHGTVVGIIVAVVVLVVVLAILLAVYMVRRQRKIRREKVANILGVVPDHKSQLSFLSDGKSSTLGKQPSLLSHESSMMRYPGIQTVAFTGTKAHSLDYRPLMYTYSPLSSQYSSLTRNGVVLGSNLGEKARSSIKSKPSKKSVEPLPKTSMRKRSPSDLRPPFFFDKDGYFSDSSASQTNSLDKYGRRSSLDMTDAKKKKKFMGKSKNKTKKGKNYQPQTVSTTKPANESGKYNIAFNDEKTTPGREQMPEEVYIDGTQLVNKVDIPEIRVTGPEDANYPVYNNRPLRTEDSSMLENLDRFGDKYGSGELPAATSVKSAEALNTNLLMERRKDASDEHSRPDVSSLKIHPKTMTASATVHRPEDYARFGSTLAGNGNDRFETIVETSSLGYDTVDGANQQQAPTHISLLTLPEKSSHTTQRQRLSMDTPSDEKNDIETVVLNSPTNLDTVDNAKSSGHISILTLPDPNTSARKEKQKSSGEIATTSTSSGEDEVDNYPRTNLQLANQMLSPTPSASEGPNSPASASTGRPLSPTRQMGLSARHPDGSPYQLHKATRKSVKRELKQHPENRANVQDHVISFRSYPSPVHSLERAGLFRNSSRRSARYSAGDGNESL